MNTIKRPRRGTTTDNKGQADFKGVTNYEISTKDGSNVKIVKSNMRLYDESE